MRIELPSAATPPPPAITDPRPQEFTTPVSPGVSQPALREQVLITATRWSVAIPVVLVCAALLGWSLCFRLPASKRLLKIHARASPTTEETNRTFTAEDVTAMRAQIHERSAILIRTRKEIPPLLSRLDARARELGWRCDASLKPPISAPGGVRELASHPVTIDLRYDHAESERAYRHLLAWLWTASTLQPRAEVTGLKLQSLGRGLNAAQMELNFLSLNSHAEPPPK
jgi:hypothetical protein